MTETVFEPVELPSKYAKAIVAIVAALALAFSAALTDAIVTSSEVASIGIAVLTAVGVYLVPNLPAGPARWLKGIVALVGTALQAAAPLLYGGSITTSGWLMVLVAALGAVSVGIVPNTDPQLLEASIEYDATPVPDDYEPRYRSDE